MIRERVDIDVRGVLIGEQRRTEIHSHEIVPLKWKCK
jgi:hypothetical protein